MDTRPQGPALALLHIDAQVTKVADKLANGR